MWTNVLLDKLLWDDWLEGKQAGSIVIVLWQ